MSKRLTYREQLDRARQQAAVAALREAARLVSEGDYAAGYELAVDAQGEIERLTPSVEAAAGNHADAYAQDQP